MMAGSCALVLFITELEEAVLVNLVDVVSKLVAIILILEKNVTESQSCIGDLRVIRVYDKDKFCTSPSSIVNSKVVVSALWFKGR